jgi:hypothetical protein
LPSAKVDLGYEGAMILATIADLAEADEGELRGQLGALLRCFPQQTHPTALELSQVCIGLPRSLSSQCHLSSSSSRTTDCHFDGPTRSSADPMIVKAADDEPA